MEFPDPVIGVAIEPKTKELTMDRSSRNVPRHRSRQRGPDLQGSYVDIDTVADHNLRHGRAPPRDHRIDRLLREFKVDANVGRPQVAYKETIRPRWWLGGSLRPPDRWLVGQYGARQARGVARASRGSGFDFESRRSHGRRVSQSSSSRPVRKGVRRGHDERGVLAGYPVVDVIKSAVRRVLGP